MRELIDAKPGMSMDILQLPICLIDLARIPSDQLRGHPAVCALLDSLQSASAGRLAERVTGIFSRLRNIREESKLKSWSTALATYFIAVQRKTQESVDALFQALKTLYNIKEADKMTMTIAEGWIEEGIAKGKVEGRTEGKVEAILSILESRFGEIPAGTQKKLTNLRDDSRIEKTIRLAATCQTLKEFQKAL